MPATWKRRFELLASLAEKGEGEEVTQKLSAWADVVKDAPCAVRVKWVEYAINFSELGPRRDSLIRELRSLKPCIAQSDWFRSGTTLGAYYYRLGQFDSSFYSFTDAFTAASRSRDTNAMVLSLSNLAALYSEMNWKVEALSTALRAYTLAKQSTKISDLTQLYLNNNVAGLKLDLGYVDRARKVLADYNVEDLKADAEEIHVLRAVNAARIRIHDAEGNPKALYRILKEVEVNPSAWVMVSSFVVSDTLCPPEVLLAIHDAYVRKVDVFSSDTATFVNFGIPALGAIALHHRIDEGLRLKASLLRPWVEALPLGAMRQGYLLAMAQIFKLSDYWQDYWEASEAIVQRDLKYADLQNEVLRAFNKQVGIENTVLQDLESSKVLVRTLILVASVLLAISLGLYFWVNGRYRNSLREHRALVAENERLAKNFVLHENHLDELRALARKAGKSLQTEKLEELLERMERDRPSAVMDLPDAVVRSYDLTSTEAKVLMQLAYGYRNSEIAQMLDISKSYIHNVRSKLRQKLPLAANEELEDFAISLRKSYQPTTPPGGSRTSA